jgi:undecaprenyl-diphosphatase
VTRSLDLELARWVADHRSALLTRVFHDMEAIGESLISYAVVLVVGLIVVARLGLWWGLPRIMLALALVVVIGGNMKERIGRPRPPADLAVSYLSGPGMPSSHAYVTSVVVTAVLLTPWWTSVRLHRLATIIGIAGCLLTGIAMIYLGGHWLSDVLVGWAVGVSAAVLAVKVRPQRRRVEPA